MDMAALMAKIFGTGTTPGISGGAGSMVPQGGQSPFQKFGSVLSTIGNTGSMALGGDTPNPAPTTPAAPADGNTEILALLQRMFSRGNPPWGHNGGRGGGPGPDASRGPMGGNGGLGSQMGTGTGGLY